MTPLITLTALALTLGSGARADVLTLDSGGEVSGTLEAWDADGACRIAMDAGRLAGATLEVPCARILRFERSQPVDLAAAAVPAVEPLQEEPLPEEPLMAEPLAEDALLVDTVAAEAPHAREAPVEGAAAGPQPSAAPAPAERDEAEEALDEVEGILKQLIAPAVNAFRNQEEAAEPPAPES